MFLDKKRRNIILKLVLPISTENGEFHFHEPYKKNNGQLTVNKEVKSQKSKSKVMI